MRRSRGFDTELIEARTVEADKMMHPTLGLCYRVKTANMNALSSGLNAPMAIANGPSLLIRCGTDLLPGFTVGAWT